MFLSFGQIWSVFILIQETILTIQTVQLCVQKISQKKKKEENKTVYEK